MVRVAGLKRRIATGVAVRAASGLMPREVLDRIWADDPRADGPARRGSSARRSCPRWPTEGIDLVRWDELDREEQKLCKRLFRERVFPVLTPLAVDPAHPFPYISGLSLNLAVLVRNPKTGKEHFARVKVPPIFRRFVPLGNRALRPLEDVIAAHLERLFPGMEVLEHHTFRVTRNEDLEVEEDDAENLLQALEKELLRRRFGPPVRLEVEDVDRPARARPAGPRARHHRATRSSGCPARSTCVGLFTHRRPGPRRGLKYPRVRAGHPPAPRRGRVGRRRRHLRRDRAARRPAAPPVRLVRHVACRRFLEQAAADPDVLAIKQTLYRTSGDSPIVDALIDAAEAGKQVLVLVEIKARFDEQANINWARKLEQAGCHVVYGLVGLKTHCKLSLVVRQEPDGLAPLRPHRHRQLQPQDRPAVRGPRPAHRRPGGRRGPRPPVQPAVRLLAADASYKRLLVAPTRVRDGLIERIDREIDAPPRRPPAGIRIKVNSIVDEAIIDALYRASQAGVPVDLLVRGICALRPGVPGLSENIRVRSILGRFLEHCRVFWFGNGGEPEVWIGSADLMHRNLDRRVEVLVQLPGEDNVAQVSCAARPGLRAHDVRLAPGQRRRVDRERRPRPPPGGPDRAAAAPRAW